MKNKFHIISLFFFASIIFSCDSDDLEYQNELKMSQNTWSNFKQSNNDSYKYTAVSNSWTGFSWETTNTIENGIITQRHFKYTSTEGLSNGIPNSELEWTEVGNEIGTHENGTEPLTLDEIYDKAQKEWLIERDNSKTYFETANNGMISTCGYVENDCADDCFIGIHINNIEGL
jgi:hypothetical protein